MTGRVSFAIFVGAFSLTVLLVSGASANPVKPFLCNSKTCTKWVSVSGHPHCISWVRKTIRCH